MLSSSQKLSGHDYTATIAFALIGLVVSPAVLLMFRPITDLQIVLALTLSALSLLIARACWKYYSRLSIPSMEMALRPRSK